ncbi:MAG: phosphatidylglycerophosphatase A [Rickettsiales bacterium]|jgi:phosphatidylglycerophosphatase A|nr:phosphatidylglycerophosphatase A [Rickettsiales bacterium]
MKFKIASVIATFFGVGYIKKAPGTFGSLTAFPLFVLINILIKNNKIEEYLLIAVIYLIDIIILYLLSYWSINIYISTNKKEDPSEVVIDEVVGQILAYMFATLFPYYNVKNFMIFNILYLTLPFVFFRFFDIIKPSLVGYCDKNIHGANGVILDDVVAGIFAGICSTLILWVV